MNSLIFSNPSANLDETNGNLMGTIVPTASNEDESLSLSEYTDNEKSAPTELLAEFLTSIMKKDYVNALKYCKLILDYEPSNKTAKDFYPQLLAKVNEQQHSTSSDGSDKNCNYTSSLEFVDNAILDNDMENDVSETSSITSSISSNENCSDASSNSDEAEQRDRDLINSLSHSSSQSSNLSRSDQLPESMSSTASNRENTSNSFSFASLELVDDEDVNNNEAAAPALAPVRRNEAPSSPFTSKIMQMIKGRWDGSPSKQN